MLADSVKRFGNEFVKNAEIDSYTDFNKLYTKYASFCNVRHFEVVDKQKFYEDIFVMYGCRMVSKKLYSGEVSVWVMGIKYIGSTTEQKVIVYDALQHSIS